MRQDQSAAPDRVAQSIAITGDLDCVLLHLPDELPEGEDPDTRLLRRHSPELVILPDADGIEAKPYDNGHRDYHPHAVELYLSGVGTVRQVPRRILGVVNVLVTGLGYASLGAGTILALAEGDREWMVGLLGFGVLVALFGGLFAYRYRYRGTPRGESALMQLAGQGDRGEDLATTVFPKAGAGSAAQAWEQYGRIVVSKKPPNVVYGRVRRDSGFTVLQYWLFYYYNDWWNQHEADWEVVMVFLDAAERPMTVACSSHLAGSWRPWDATERVDPDALHPRVYVARGSHALYFSAARGFHDAVLHQPWAVFDFRGRLTVRGQKDAVGTPTLGREPYEMRVIPDGIESRSDDPRWPEWWWLQFRGRLGAKDGILSPAIQDDGLRWDRPVEWAACRCDADSSSWREVTQPKPMSVQPG